MFPLGDGRSSKIFLRTTSCLAVDGRLEEAAVLLVGEEVDREPREPVRLLEPAQLAGRGMQLEQPVRDVGVVLEEPGALRDAVAPGAVQPPLRRRERPEQELAERARPRRSTPARPSTRPHSASAASVEPVPGRDRLVVARAASAAARAARRAAAACASSSSPAQDEAAALERVQQLVRELRLRRAPT